MTRRRFNEKLNLSFQTQEDFDSGNDSFDEGAEFAASSGYSEDELMSLIPVQDASDHWFVGFRNKEYFDSIIDHDFDSKKEAMAFIKGATSGLNESVEYLYEDASGDELYLVSKNDLKTLIEYAQEVIACWEMGGKDDEIRSENKLNAFIDRITSNPVKN